MNRTGEQLGRAFLLRSRDQIDRADLNASSFMAVVTNVSGDLVAVRDVAANIGGGQLIARAAGPKVSIGDAGVVHRLRGGSLVFVKVGGEIAGGVFFDQDTNGSATTPTNSSTTVYQEVTTWTLTLPAGTWSVWVQASAIYSNDTASRGANSRITGSMTSVTGQGFSPVLANAPFPLWIEASGTGLSGTLSIVLEYVARTGGVASAFHNSMLLRAIRTA